MQALYINHHGNTSLGVRATDQWEHWEFMSSKSSRHSDEPATAKMSTVTQLENISKYILSKPLLKSIFVPASRVFISLAGHRKMGLRTEDLISEESEVMQTAIRRLPAKDTYERVFRFATAVQLSLSHHLLPKDQWLKPEDVS
jgi:ubiquinol-cytochrome c reductase subunit 7